MIGQVLAAVLLLLVTLCGAGAWLAHRMMKPVRDVVATARTIIDTGDLDARSAEDVLQVLTRLNREFGKTILMVTHDNELAVRARRTIRLVDGRIEDEFVNR